MKRRPEKKEKAFILGPLMKNIPTSFFLNKRLHIFILHWIQQIMYLAGILCDTAVLEFSPHLSQANFKNSFMLST